MNATAAYRQATASEPLSPRQLALENQRFAGTGGVSVEARSQKFVPGFLDTATGRACRSCFTNGRPAPFHCIDGLPDTLVEARSDTGQVLRVRPSVVAGFLRDGYFYTREEAAALQTRQESRLS